MVHGAATLNGMRYRMLRQKIIWHPFCAYKKVIVFSAFLMIFGLLAGCQKAPCHAYFASGVKQTITLRRARDVCVLKQNGVHVQKVGQIITLIFPSDSLFVNRTTEFQENAEPILNYAADLIQTYHTMNVKVAGFSDKTHEEKTKSGTYERALTRRQANAVARYLWSRKVNARLMYAIGEGGEHPVAWNAFPIGRKLNRRIEVRFQYYLNNKAWY